MIIRTLFASAAVLFAVTLLQPPLESTASQLYPLKAVPGTSTEAIFEAKGGQSQPLLVAGNTACNPRVTVCEE